MSGSGRGHGCGGAFAAFHSNIAFGYVKNKSMSTKQLASQFPGRTVIRRIEALDLFKFLVLFFMIQGHLFRAYLLVPIRQTPWFRIHEALHGIVAPGFLFAAGFAAFLSYTNKKEQYLHPGSAFFVRLKRILFIIWLGYWIHLPFFSLGKTVKQIWQGTAGDFFKVDILQCIGVGLLLFTLAAVLLKKQTIIVVISALFSLVFFLAPPLVHKVHMGYIIDFYLGSRVSLFPLFPWAGFLFAGILCAYGYSLLEKELFFKLALILGIAFFPWYFLFKSTVRAELTLPGILTKFGGIFLLLWFANWLVRVGGRWVKLLIRAGKESLFVYVLHLFIIFGSAFKHGLNVRFKNSLYVHDALLLCLAVQLSVFSLALFYHELKEKHSFTWRILFYLFWFVFVTLFILRRF